MKRAFAVLAAQPPAWSVAGGGEPSTVNMVYWYFGVYAAFPVGGDLWETYHKRISEALFPNQRIGGDADGGWDPVGELGPIGGRVYSTALGAMILETLDRFRREQARKPPHATHR